ncbi:DUF6268 family outer membrane beta-barrel protein [Aeoliella sp. SH292]|uniref:DUF6268 family outer membrane beta-barrel protein n=1 Tax=Aeoliella sp. SH292 TaxID=3454464 RepID=UPI003F9DCA3E
MKHVVLPLLLLLALAANAAAQFQQPYLPQYGQQYVQQEQYVDPTAPVYVESADTAPVYVEPYQVDPWATAAPSDVVIVDQPMMQMQMPTMQMDGQQWSPEAYPEPSAAQQDLGNLIPSGSRKSFFQRVNFSAAWMPQLESDGIGVTSLNTSIVTALPFFRMNQPLTITPRYGVQFLEGPDFIDVPARLHDADVNFTHIRRLSDRWVFNGSVTVGAYADDYSFRDADAIRWSGYAFGIYEASEAARWIVGVAYLNRANLTVVPAAGFLYWTDDLKIDVVLPQPRIAWRTWTDVGPPGLNERWFYFQGDLGGGIWAVQRDDGSPDTLSYSDLRVIFGTERKQYRGITRKWEVGYVFARDLEYSSMGTDFAIDDTLFVRGAFTY